MLSRGLRRAQSIQRLIAKLDKFIIAILVGNNFVNIAISTILTAICVFIFGYKWGVIIATLTAAFFIVIICEITPKVLAIKHTERVALLIAPLMEIFIKLFAPITAIFNSFSNILIKLLRIKSDKRSPLVTEEELRLMIEIGKEEGFLSDEERKMLQRIFEFGDTKVADVMIPKEEIVSVNKNATSEELLNIFVEKGHARLPVYDGSIDNTIGIIYAHDLLYILRDKGLFVPQDLMHEPYFVSSQMRVTELLKRFQSDKLQIAVVVNSHKKTLGLVTLEDLIEEIIGEIEERYVHTKTKKN
jgi:CBS domain containing-hemolysin-like protein